VTSGELPAFRAHGRNVSLNIPPAGAYLDAVLGGRELWPGDTPRLGDQFICCIAIEGFPAESWWLLDTTHRSLS
jgi:type IV secretion system protein VirB4